jgi:hypothetical protein
MLRLLRILLRSKHRTLAAVKLDVVFVEFLFTLTHSALAQFNNRRPRSKESFISQNFTPKVVAAAKRR